MKVLVIPDVHLKPWLFDRAETILKEKKADRAVCLMDIPDDWGMELKIERYQETYDRMIAFAIDHPDTLWCYGNHDISYPWCELETGYSSYAEETVLQNQKKFEGVLSDPGQLTFVHRIDNVLFSHGGLTSDYVRVFYADLLRADIDTVLDAVNHGPRSSLWRDDSPLWVRPQYYYMLAFRGDEYIQVVGHTPVETIHEKDGFISTDVFSTYRDGTQIGECAMLVIDSETKEYEKLEVPAKEEWE